MDSVVPIKELTHEHIWGPWMVRDRFSHYRVCVYPDCKSVENREAKKES